MKAFHFTAPKKQPDNLEPFCYLPTQVRGQGLRQAVSNKQATNKNMVTTACSL
jgi:hypothetical protein